MSRYRTRRSFKHPRSRSFYGWYGSWRNINIYHWRMPCSCCNWSRALRRIFSEGSLTLTHQSVLQRNVLKRFPDVLKYEIFSRSSPFWGRIKLNSCQRSFSSLIFVFLCLSFKLIKIKLMISTLQFQMICLNLRRWRISSKIHLLILGYFAHILLSFRIKHIHFHSLCWFDHSIKNDILRFSVCSCCSWSHFLILIMKIWNDDSWMNFSLLHHLFKSLLSGRRRTTYFLWFFNNRRGCW